MQDFNLNDFDWFLVLAHEKSFTRAAARLGIAQSTLSHMIKRMEARLGLRLLARTTRSVALTEAGAQLVAAVQPRLEAIRADLSQLIASGETLSGQVRLTLSDHALDWAVWPRLAPLLRSNPGLKLELHIDSGLRDIVAAGFDAGIRLGESLEKDMVAARVSPDWRLLTVGSPAYFAQTAAPLHPRDLMTHRCINFRHKADGDTYQWEFSRDGHDLRLRVDGGLTVNSTQAALRGAAEGFGIAYVPEDHVRSHLADGSLVACLDDWCPTFPGYFLYYPSRKQNSAAFNAVVAALRWNG